MVAMLKYAASIVVQSGSRPFMTEAETTTYTMNIRKVCAAVRMLLLLTIRKTKRLLGALSAACET